MEGTLFESYYRVWGISHSYGLSSDLYEILKDKYKIDGFKEDEWKMSIYSIMILEEFELWNGGLKK